MKFTVLCATLLSMTAALSHEHVSGHEYKLMKRHHKLAARASPRVAPAASIKRRAGPSRMDKRKVLGQGDTDKAPDNLAEGTATKGCAVWHTVEEGEVCLGLIDKSSSGFTLEQFLKLNPSLNDQCSNLVNGKAYCVDTVAGKSASKPIKAKPATTPTTTPRVAAVQPPSSTDDEDLEDCDESDEPISGPDTVSADTSEEEEETPTVEEPEEEECEEEETTDSSNDTTSSDSGLDIPLPDLDLPTTTKTAEKPARTQEGSGNSGSNSGNNSNSDSSSNGNNSSSNDNSGSDANLSQSGTATWYEQNGNPGNCGNYNNDDVFIVALFTPQYEGGSHCGKKIRLVNTANGNTAVATVEDSCPSCQKNGNIDLSKALFESLSDNNLGLGILSVKWDFI